MARIALSCYCAALHQCTVVEAVISNSRNIFPSSKAHPLNVNFRYVETKYTLQGSSCNDARVLVGDVQVIWMVA